DRHCRPAHPRRTRLLRLGDRDGGLPRVHAGGGEPPAAEALAPTRIAGDRAHRPRDRADADGPRAEQARRLGPQDLESLESEARASSGQPRGRITVGGFSTGIRGLLVPSLPPLRAAAPELTVTNIEEEPDELIELVTAGRIDASLILDWHNSSRSLPPTLASALITVGRADIIMHRDHHLATRAEVGRPDLVGQVFVSAPRNAVCHRWLTALFEDLHSQPRIEYWALEYDTQVEFVRAMGALALVPRLGRPHLPSDVTVVPLDDPAIARTIHLVWRQSMSSSPAIARLLEQMQ